MVNVSVILSTYNRCRTLEKALSSVAASTLPESIEWEVLVVDNNSSDRTREVVEDFCSRYPGRFRYLFEREQGKSYALNTGIREARGDVLAFMDDDVSVEPTWLRNLTGELHNREWAGAGGRIILQWPPSLPAWLLIDGPLARHGFPGFDQGQEAKQLVGPPFGTNMAFRKGMFEKYGGFRTDLGPSPSNQIPRPSEDTEFGRRLIAGGERLRYEPSAVVYHPIPRDRINKADFLRWGFDLGRANVRISGIRPGTKWFVGDIPLYLIRRFAIWTARWMVTFEPSRRFSHKVTAWEKAGEIVECCRQGRTADVIEMSAERSAGRNNDVRSL
jgi:glycosyltransferase involved in cell wall biosynthesis